jgi:hypothetical protein
MNAQSVTDSSIQVKLWGVTSDATGLALLEELLEQLLLQLLQV